MRADGFSLLLDKGQVAATSAGPHQIPFEIKNSKHSAAYTLVVVVTYVPGPPPAAPVEEKEEPEEPVEEPVDAMAEALTAEVSEANSYADRASEERARKEAAEQLVALLEAGAVEVEIIVLTADESSR